MAEKVKVRAKVIGWVLAAAVVLAATTIVVREALPPRGLPAVPDLTGRPEALRDAVLAADSKARAWFANFDKVADLGRVYHANGYDREATMCWALLSREQPTEGRWPYYLADVARNSADNEGMAVHLKEALRRAPDYSTGWLRLADAAFKIASFDEAETAYRRRLELIAGDPYARLGLARIALQRGEKAEGRSALEALVLEAPDFPSAQNFYAGLLASEGDEKGAARHRWLGTVAERFREADDPWLLELRPHCFDSYQLSVWAAQEAQTKHPDRARALLERAITVAPRDPLPYAELGQLLFDQGEREAAREVLASGVKLAPFDQKVWLRLSGVLRELGRPNEALENDRRGLAQAPDAYEFLNSIGQSQSALGQLAEAELSFQKAMQRAPNAVSVQFNLGSLYLQSGRRSEARRLLESAFKSNPGYPNLVIALGKMALEDGRLDDAENVIRPFFDQYPGANAAKAMLTQLHLQRAMAAVAAKDWVAAERWCTSGLADVPEAAELLGLVGGIHMRNGDVPKALVAMEACQRLRPGDPRAVMPLAALYRDLKRPEDARRVLIEGRDWLKQHGRADLIPQFDSMLESIQGG